jgi:hypothetical protein
MRRLKVLLTAAALVAALSFVPAATPKADAQVGIGINLGAPPVCQYGYYDYAPYACAPYGFYGPGYFYNGIFLGVGPWFHWGYAHGWGAYRFRGPGGGHYGPGFGGYGRGYGRGGGFAAHGGGHPGGHARGGGGGHARGGGGGHAHGGGGHGGGHR